MKRLLHLQPVDLSVILPVQPQSNRTYHIQGGVISYYVSQNTIKEYPAPLRKGLRGLTQSFCPLITNLFEIATLLPHDPGTATHDTFSGDYRSAPDPSDILHGINLPNE